MSSDELVQHFQRCKIAFEGYLLQPQEYNALRVDMQLVAPSSRSQWTDETPPQSPGIPSSPVLFEISMRANSAFVVRSGETVHNDECLPVELILKVLWHASLPTLIAFKATSQFWRTTELDLPPTTARLWRCWQHYRYLVRHGWRGSSPGIQGIWECNLAHIQRWITRFETTIDESEVVARLPVSFVRFLKELSPPSSSIPSVDYLSAKRPSLPPSPPKSTIPFWHEFSLQLEGMYLLNHPSWYTEDLYVRHCLTPTRYTDLTRPWFTKRDRKLFERKYHLIRGLPPRPPASKCFPHAQRLSPSRDYSSDTSDDGTPDWEKNMPEGPHAFGPNLIHFAQHTLQFSEKEEEWPPAHILCVQIANLQPARRNYRRASQPAFLLDIEVECLKSDDMAFLEWCIPDDGVEYHLVMAVEGEMQGYVFVEAERQLLTLVGVEWGEIFERWLTRCVAHLSRNDDISFRGR